MKFKSIDEYLSLQPPLAKKQLQHIRQLVHSAIPAAEETISYSLPAFRYCGKILIYFAGFKNHYSIFPANTTLIQLMEKDLLNYKSSKGTIQFELEKPFPISLIKKIIKLRMKQNFKMANNTKN